MLSTVAVGRGAEEAIWATYKHTPDPSAEPLLAVRSVCFGGTRYSLVTRFLSLLWRWGSVDMSHKAQVIVILSARLELALLVDAA